MEVDPPKGSDASSEHVVAHHAGGTNHLDQRGGRQVRNDVCWHQLEVVGQQLLELGRVVTLCPPTDAFALQLSRHPPELALVRLVRARDDGDAFCSVNDVNSVRVRSAFRGGGLGRAQGDQALLNDKHRDGLEGIDEECFHLTHADLIIARSTHLGFDVLERGQNWLVLELVVTSFGSFFPQRINQVCPQVLEVRSNQRLPERVVGRRQVLCHADGTEQNRTTSARVRQQLTEH